jgi:hypothetical protein
MTKTGKPPLVDEEVDSIFRKLEPYLKKGLSLNKACLEAQIPKSTAYDLYREYEEFAERIDACKNYYSILISDIISIELNRIVEKQKKKESLDSNEVKFIQWVALNSNATRREFGREYDPIPEEVLEKEREERLGSLYRELHPL